MSTYLTSSDKPFRAHGADGLEPVWAGDDGDEAGIFLKLSQEWTRLDALPSMSRTLRRWAKSEPVLAGHSSLGALVDHIDSAHRAEEDQLLLALIRLAHGGQQLAGRVLLQAMLPKIFALVRKTRPSSNDDRWTEDRRHIAVATFWEVLATYPADRRHNAVAGNLALDTLHQLTSSLRKPPADIPVDPQDATNRLGHRSYEPKLSSDGLTCDADLLEVIAWGVDAGAINSQEAALLVQVYLPSPNEDLHPTVQADGVEGLSPAAIRQRCSRARRRLIAAVQADLANPAQLAQTA